MFRERWERAQKAENKYWHSRHKWLDNFDIYKVYWGEIIKTGYDLEFDFFADKRVLEIGCGPAGIIFSIENAKYRVGIEPLDISEFLKDPIKREIVQTGLAENIEFKDNFFDLVLCFNVLDHTVKPLKVIQEVHRVLTSDGEFLLWLHTLMPRYNFLRPVLDKLDSPHPHHFNTAEVLELVQQEGFSIKFKRIFKGLGPTDRSTTIPPNKNIKIALGNRMTEDLWLRLKKK